MGMQNWSTNTDVVQRKTVEAIAGSLDALETILALYGTDLDMFAYACEGGDLCQKSNWEESVSEEEDAAICLIWHKIESKFKEESGLDLSLMLISDEDTGDMEIGVNFVVDGMYELTEAGKLMQSYVTSENSVTYGGYYDSKNTMDC